MEGLTGPIHVVAARQILTLSVNGAYDVAGGIALGRINVHRGSQEAVFSLQRFRTGGTFYVGQSGERNHLTRVGTNIKLAQRFRRHTVWSIGLNNHAEDFSDTCKVVDVLAAHKVSERVVNVRYSHSHRQRLRFVNREVKLRSVCLNHRAGGTDFWFRDQTLTEIFGHLLQFKRIIRFSGLNVEVQTAGAT